TVTASYSGDASFAASSATLVGGQRVDQAGTSTVLVSSTNPSVFGQGLTFTATISSGDAGTPTGTVQFQIDGSDAGGPVSVTTADGVTAASLSNTSLTVGSHT